MTALTLLAENLADNNFGDTRSGGLAGPMGLFIIVVLAIGTVLLIRNMNSRLRRLPGSFPSTGAPGSDPSTDGAASAGGPSTTSGPAELSSTDERSQP
jgi:hypothetical protein